MSRLRLPGSLRSRIALAAVAAVALVGLIAAPILLAAIERDGRDAVDQDLRERAERVGPPRGGSPPFGGNHPGVGRPGVTRPGFGRPGPPPGAPPARDREEERLLAGSGTFVQVESNGELVRRIGDVPSEAPGVPDSTGFDTISIAGSDWRSLTVDGRPGSGDRVQLLATLEPVEDRVGRVRRIVILLGLSALLVTGLAAWAFTSLATRPLARLRAGATRVSGTEDLTTTLPEDDGPDEVRSLASALNGMLGRLRSSMLATRRFAADAGHELRTPLTGMRANLDALERNPDLSAAQRAELVRETLDEQTRIVALLDGLQALARGEAAESLPREDVELADLVDTAVFGARRRHPGVGYELVDDIGDAVVHGWPGGLRLIVDNLLDNAAIHGGGSVRVALERRDGGVLIRVDDDGPGIPPEERDRLLEPFARGTAAAVATEGTGLGLAIVAQQVALHGGTLTLTESPLGGLGVEARLPGPEIIRG